MTTSGCRGQLRGWGEGSVRSWNCTTPPLLTSDGVLRFRSYGKVAGLRGLTLIGLRAAGVTVAATHVVRLSAGFAIEGVFLDDPDDDAFIRRVEMPLPALGPLLQGGLIYQHPKRARLQRSNHKVTAEFGSIEWTNADIGIRWSRVPSTTWSPSEVTVRLSPVVTLTSSSPRSFNYWLEEWISPTLRTTRLRGDRPIHRN